VCKSVESLVHALGMAVVKRGSGIACSSRTPEVAMRHNEITGELVCNLLRAAVLSMTCGGCTMTLRRSSIAQRWRNSCKRSW
jgi:hypothetical protein